MVYVLTRANFSLQADQALQPRESPATCNCHSCHNNVRFEWDRQAAVVSTLERNPHAFRPKITQAGQQGIVDSPSKARHMKGCHCKKSGCLKKYCECFQVCFHRIVCPMIGDLQAAVMCSDNCKCVECRNNVENLTLLSMGGFKVKHGIDFAAVSKDVDRSTTSSSLSSAGTVLKPIQPGNQEPLESATRAQEEEQNFSLAREESDSSSGLEQMSLQNILADHELSKMCFRMQRTVKGEALRDDDASRGSSSSLDSQEGSEKTESSPKGATWDEQCRLRNMLAVCKPHEERAVLTEMAQFLNRANMLMQANVAENSHKGEAGREEQISMNDCCIATNVKKVKHWKRKQKR
eukprot:766457-Hanusia_phi.AAC.11